MTVSRFGVSLEEETLIALDEYVKDNNFANRSRAIRFLIENNLVEKKWKCDNIVAGAITLVYDQSKKDILFHTAEVHKEYNDVIMSVTRYQLNEQNCMELFAIQGASRRLTELSEKLISIKGMQHGKLIMSKSQ
jgi:CopG family transcriptional regulator, nickel-responsive regulator